MDWRTIKRNLPTLLLYAVFIFAVYLINVQVQTYFGERALAATGMESLPLATAFDVAAREDKLVLADMSAIWCTACRRLDKRVFADAAVKAAIAQRFVFSRIEYESEQGEAFMARYNVRGYPTVLILTANGDLVRRLPLTFDPQEFIRQLAIGGAGR